MAKAIGTNVFLGREQNEEQDYSEETAIKIDKEISNLLTEGKNNANKILKKHKKELELLADALLKYETLDADQFRALMEGKELDIKVIPTPDTKIKDKEKEFTQIVNIFIYPKNCLIV